MNPSLLQDDSSKIQSPPVLVSGPLAASSLDVKRFMEEDSQETV
ncbi:MAG: hypothetical protein PF518_12860 [Spirochaetaceae bacterium]|nr:hypothetical protein [Spirochaetaceae bacterium]